MTQRNLSWKMRFGSPWGLAARRGRAVVRAGGTPKSLDRGRISWGSRWCRASWAKEIAPSMLALTQETTSRIKGDEKPAEGRLGTGHLCGVEATGSRGTRWRLAFPHGPRPAASTLCALPYSGPDLAFHGGGLGIPQISDWSLTPFDVLVFIRLHYFSVFFLKPRIGAHELRVLLAARHLENGSRFGAVSQGCPSRAQ